MRCGDPELGCVWCGGGEVWGRARGAEGLQHQPEPEPGLGLRAEVFEPQRISFPGGSVKHRSMPSLPELLFSRYQGPNVPPPNSCVKVLPPTGMVFGGGSVGGD